MEITQSCGYLSCTLLSSTNGCVCVFVCVHPTTEWSDLFFFLFCFVLLYYEHVLMKRLEEKTHKDKDEHNMSAHRSCHSEKNMIK